MLQGEGEVVCGVFVCPNPTQPAKTAACPGCQLPVCVCNVYKNRSLLNVSFAMTHLAMVSMKKKKSRDQ